MDKWKKWNFWKKAKAYCESRMSAAWMIGGNCDSCCPRCKIWESHGNAITTKVIGDGSQERNCSICGFKWQTIFTPARFVRIDN